MAIDFSTYRPTLVDEHLNMRDVDNDGDLDATLCRAAATLMAADAWTGGDLTAKPTGGRRGKAWIKATLGKMRRATGEPNRYGYNQSHTPAFLQAINIPRAAYDQVNGRMAEAKALLSKGYVITLAGDVGFTPGGSPLRKYVNPGVGHEIIITRISKDGTKAAFIDPMTRHGTAKYERWAPWSHFVAFAKRFGSQLHRVWESWKRGAGSKVEAQRTAKRTWRALAQENAEIITRKEQRIEDLNESMMDVEQEAEDLTHKLMLCETSDDKARIEYLEEAMERIQEEARKALI